MSRQLRKIYLKYEIYLPLVVAVVTLIFITILVTVPRLNEIQLKQEIIKSNAIHLDKLIKKRAALESVTSRETTSLLEIAQVTLPDDKDIPGIITTFENLVLLTKVGLDSINLTPGFVSSESGKPKESLLTVNAGTRKNAYFLPLSIDLIGTEAQVLEFLRIIQASKRIYDLNTLTLNEIEIASEEETYVSAKIGLNVYFLPPITQIGDVDQALNEITTEEKITLEKIATFPVYSELLLPGAGDSLPIGKDNLFFID